MKKKQIQRLEERHVEDDDICVPSFFPMLKQKAGLQANEN